MRFSKLSNHDAFSNLAESTPVGHVRSLSEAAVNPGGMIKFEPGLRRRIFFSGRFLTGKVAVNHIWGQRVNPLLVGAARVVATTRSFNGDGYSFTKHRRCLFKVLSFYVSCCRPSSKFLGQQNLSMAWKEGTSLGLERAIRVFAIYLKPMLPLITGTGWTNFLLGYMKFHFC